VLFNIELMAFGRCVSDNFVGGTSDIISPCSLSQHHVIQQYNQTHFFGAEKQPCTIFTFALLCKDIIIDELCNIEGNPNFNNNCNTYRLCIKIEVVNRNKTSQGYAIIYTGINCII
jgi:hypothetical protein